MQIDLQPSDSEQGLPIYLVGHAQYVEIIDSVLIEYVPGTSYRWAKVQFPTWGVIRLE